jgi:hypothetical protein
VEHIFPQGPTSQNLRDYFNQDVPAEDDAENVIKSVTYSLGNLALLTTTENSVADRNVYTVKRREPYSQTAFRLTKYLAVDMTIGKNAAINSVVKEFALSPVAAWNPSALARRTEIMQNLMLARWPLLPHRAS